MRSAATLSVDRAWAARWSQTGAAALALAVVVLLFLDTARAMVATWYGSTTFGHCFLIIPICIYLACRRSGALAATELRPAWGGVFAVAAASLGWLLGSATGTLIVEELSLVAAIQGVILTMCGWLACRKLAFPLLYLYFAVPFGQALVPPLQSATGTLAVAMLKGVGMPVFADGNVISVPNGNFYVAEACSGIRFLIASIALGVLFAGITYRSWYRRAIFIALSAAIPILANGTRAFGIIVIAYLTSNEFALGIDHLIYGWIFFSVVTMSTLAIGLGFRDQPEPGVETPVIGSLGDPKAVRRMLVAGIIALAPIVAAKLYSAVIDASPAPVSLRLQPPLAAGPWRRVDGLQDPAAPRFAAPDAELHVGYYRYNRRGAQVVSSAHALEGGKRWIGAAKGTTSAVVDGELVSVQFARMVRGTEGHVVWYWYWVDGRFTGSPYLAKLLEARAKLVGGEPAAAIIAIGADYSATPADAEAALRDFLSELGDLSILLPVSAKH